MTDSRVRIDRNGHVAEVVLNRPKKLNLMDPPFFKDVHSAFEELDKDEEIRF